MPYFLKAIELSPPSDGEATIRQGDTRRPGVIEEMLVSAGLGQPVGLVLAEGRGDQAEGPLGLPVSEQVRAVLPVRDHAQSQTSENLTRWSSRFGGDHFHV